MKKYINDLTVCANKKLNPQYFILSLTSKYPLPEMLPGQFVEVKINNNHDVFLRRPISIHQVDYEKNILYLLIKVVGKGTQTLSKLKAGDTLNIIYPLGNTFTYEGVKKALLAGGGCGIAPMLYLAAFLHKNNIETDILLGGRTSEDILEEEEFEKYGKVFVATDDGSLGEKGFLTKHSVFENLSSYDRLYCCGPTPMMKVMAGIATEKNIDCEVSLENLMACGIGACLCCVTATTEGHKCVCTEGPVFNTKQLIW
ncbi:MAG: dihydroorotate dehydrogenase electron transfer subunit [Bacteroidales bacterium]|jgi:dihydroorotate dehydrogenase electron transfer subunit|nr:dihydroorotate dehydrogenase electron transfer subunit [Bacteroidales bacterium]